MDPMFQLEQISEDEANYSHVMRYQTSAELACRMYEGDYIDKYGISSRWLCDWLNCVAAMGIAGMGRCPGNPFIVDCPEFMTEPEFAKWCEV